MTGKWRLAISQGMCKNKRGNQENQVVEYVCFKKFTAGTCILLF